MKIVIKVGGALYAKGISKLINDLRIVAEKNEIVLVHGGGPQITNVGEKMGREAKHYKTPKGMRTRYTDKDQIENIKMAIGGEVNKGIVESLRNIGVNAFGFCGLDGGVIQAKRKEKIMVVNEQGKRLILRGEYSGKPENVNPEIIEFLLTKGYVPVIGSMCESENGEALNVDGDRAAIAVATAINADKYISLTDVEGIYKDMKTKEVIPHISLVEAESMLKNENITGGMKKKLFAATTAIKQNVKEFIIYSGNVEYPISDILDKNKGTVISQK